MLVRISGARRILEVGALAGYSTICLARALPAGGRLISLEVAPKHAQIANHFVSQAGLAEKVEIRVGPALTSLEALAADARFDLMFIDANKDQYPEYLDWALRLVRPGGLILADNALSRALVPEQGGRDTNARGTQTYNDRVAQDPRLEATILLTRDGLDGLSVARVRDERTDEKGAFHFE
jgi:predicted O-methyltransferase YrrM